MRTRPLRTITYHRDRIGRIRQKDSHLDGGEILSTHYRYDKLNRLIQAHNAHSELRFGYDHNGLVKEQLIHLDEPLSSGISRSQSKDVAAQITEHRYDVLGNRIQTILPTGEILNRLYYGSGHLHHINLDGSTLADIERDALNRPIEWTLGKLNTQFQLDPLGRLKQQIAQPNGHNKADPAVLIGRSYQYDTIGNLVRTDDQINGSRDYTYDALGRIIQSADEHYRYDPAHNLTDGSRISGNRLTQYQGTSYRYNPLGNLIEKQQHDGEIQHYRYNADNQLTEAEIHKPGESPVQYRYRYDPIGRRIAKVHSDGNEIQYLWDGSRLLQEYRKDRTYTYVYTEDRNHEPLAQITTYNGTDKTREILYYHNDQIGIPREMTDGEGNIVWSGNYSGWGKLTQEERLKSDVYQPIRLQNQHYDEETGLHYNFFRYYDPEIGRFTQQDPIGLEGGENLYAFAPNAQEWIDPLGLARKSISSRLPEGSRTGQFGPKNGKLTKLDPQTRKPIQIRSCDARGNPIKDIDFGHNHGFGDPHAHDWRYPSDKAPNKVRGEGRVLTKAEKLHLKLGKCAQAFSGLTSLSTRFIGGIGLLLLPNSISQCQDLYYSMKNPDKCGAKNK